MKRQSCPATYLMLGLVDRAVALTQFIGGFNENDVETV
jgi:hypothetical protein